LLGERGKVTRGEEKTGNGRDATSKSLKKGKKESALAWASQDRKPGGGGGGWMVKSNAEFLLKQRKNRGDAALGEGLGGWGRGGKEGANNSKRAPLGMTKGLVWKGQRE